MLRRRLILILLFALSCILSLSIGVLDFSWAELFSGNQDSIHLLINSRLPRTLAIILSASGLSIAGLIMQTMSQNNFVSPSTSGTQDAAMLGLLFASIFIGTQSLIEKLIFAFVFALLYTMIFMFFIERSALKDPVHIPLMGMMLGAILQAVSNFIAHRFDAVQVLSSISLGTFTTMTRTRYELLWIIVIPLALAFIYSLRFNLLALGKDFAMNLGVNVKQLLWLGYTIVSLMSASTYVTIGPLPFVGLIIPNLFKLYYGDHLQKSMLDMVLMGSVYVLLCDSVSRLLIFPYEISVSFTMGILGSLIFIVLIHRRGRYAQ